MQELAALLASSDICPKKTPGCCPASATVLAVAANALVVHESDALLRQVRLNVIHQPRPIPYADQAAQAGKPEPHKQQELPTKLSQKTAWLGPTGACYSFLILVGNMGAAPDKCETCHKHDGCEIHLCAVEQTLTLHS